MAAAPIPVIGLFAHPGRCWCGCGVSLATPTLFASGHRDQALRRHRLSEQVGKFLGRPGVPTDIDADAVALAALAGAGVGPGGICPWRWPRLVPTPPALVANLDALPLVFDGTDDLAGPRTESPGQWARRHPVAAAVLAGGERLTFRWSDQLYEAQQAAEWETRATPEARAARARLRELRAQRGVDRDAERAALRALWQAEATLNLDVRVPLDRAHDRRDRTGDLQSYLADLERIVAAEPLDVDAWAHLGNHHLDTAWAGHQRRARTTAADHRGGALEAYRTAVAVVERSLPTGFNGLLSAHHLANRPVYRAVHGWATAAWWAGQTDTARAAAEVMAWTNPGDTTATVYLADLDAGVEYPAARPGHEG